MTTDTAKPLAQAQLSTINGTIYTVPAATTTRTTQVVICNTDTDPLTFRLHHLWSGASVSAANALFYDATIQASQTLTLEEIFMVTGDKITGLASIGSKVTVSMYGIERA